MFVLFSFKLVLFLIYLKFKIDSLEESSNDKEIDSCDEEMTSIFCIEFKKENDSKRSLNMGARPCLDFDKMRNVSIQKK